MFPHQSLKILHRRKADAKPKYEIVRETDITLEYDRDATYDKNVKKSIRLKRSVCKDC